MPFSRSDGKFGNYLNSLFLATSATCVTGLNSFTNGIGDELTFVGQLFVLLMIQIGGLGFITLLTFIITLFSNHRESVSNNLNFDRRERRDSTALEI